MSKISKSIVTICKVDESKRLIKGIVYAPDELDCHDDWMTKDEICKAAYNFMKQARTNQVDTKHSCETVDAYVCESYIAKANDPEGYIEGSWVVAIKVDSDEVWAGVMNGDYEGLSMFGSAYRSEGEVPN